jgi:hypothetical protein
MSLEQQLSGVVKTDQNTEEETTGANTAQTNTTSPHNKSGDVTGANGSNMNNTHSVKSHGGMLQNGVVKVPSFNRSGSYTSNSNGSVGNNVGISCLSRKNSDGVLSLSRKASEDGALEGCNGTLNRSGSTAKADLWERRNTGISFMYVCVCVCVRCVRACVRACVRVCEYACVCVLCVRACVRAFA